MRQLVYILRRKPGMSLEEFQTYWREVHGPLVASHATTLGIKRYVQVHSLPTTRRITEGVRGPMAEPFDGVAELWIDREAAAGTPEEIEAAQQALAEDESNFIDFPNASFWLCDEYVFVGKEIPA